MAHSILFLARAFDRQVLSKRHGGVFRVLPPVPTALLEQELREWIFAFLRKEGCIDDALIERMRTWRHNGFSVHHSVHVRGSDQEGRQQLARYMLRAPFPLEKMEYVSAKGSSE